MKIIIDLEKIGDTFLYFILAIFAVSILIKIIEAISESEFINKSIKTAKKFIFTPKDGKPTKLNYLSWFVILPIIWMIFIIFVAYLGDKK